MSSGERVFDGNLSRADLVVVDQICDRFETAMCAGERPDLGEFLAGAAATARAHLFRELLTLEVEFLIKSDAAPAAATYRDRFPDHVNAVDVIFASFGLGSRTILDPALGPALERAEIAPGRSRRSGRLDTRSAASWGVAGWASFTSRGSWRSIVRARSR